MSMNITNVLLNISNQINFYNNNEWNSYSSSSRSPGEGDLHVCRFISHGPEFNKMVEMRRVN